MNYRLCFVMPILLVILGCGEKGTQNPATPEDATGSRALALYTMTFIPSVTVHSGDREGAADHGYLDLVEQGDVPFDESNFTLDGKLIDYDRGENLLTVQFTVENKSGPSNYPVLDPRLVFFFDYDDSNGIFNEPSDPYQLMSPDLDRNGEADVDLLMMNIDQYGDSTGSDVEDFTPAVRLMRWQDIEDDYPFVLSKGEAVTITVIIRIPNENDVDFKNYEPIKWNILIEGTFQPTLWLPHSDPVDIIGQKLPGYLVADRDDIYKTLECTVRFPISQTTTQAQFNYTVYAWLDGFDNFTGWEQMAFDLNNQTGFENRVLEQLIRCTHPIVGIYNTRKKLF